MKQSIFIKIRGNKAYDHVAKFVSMGLIIKKKVGHTSEISLSDSFYNYFNVSSTDDKNKFPLSVQEDTVPEKELVEKSDV